MQEGMLQLKACLAFVESEMAVQLSVVIAGTSISTMPPVPTPNLACTSLHI